MKTRREEVRIKLSDTRGRKINRLRREGKYDRGRRGGERSKTEERRVHGREGIG